MSRVWISLRVIEGEYETENDAADGLCDGNLDESHPLCDRIIGFHPNEIDNLLAYLETQQENENEYIEAEY